MRRLFFQREWLLILPDKRFFINNDPIGVDEVVRMVRVEPWDGGEPTQRFHRVSSLQAADSNTIVFVENRRHWSSLESRSFGLCLTSAEIAATLPSMKNIAICAEPKLAFARISARLHQVRAVGDHTGTHASARIGADVEIHPTAIVCENVKIADQCKIGAHTVIGPGVEIGAGSIIDAHASVVCTLVGDNARIKSGARLGQAGFGFVPTPAGHEFRPQLGRLVLGASVEIGANTTVDRGTLGDTLIGDGTKIDNLVQIGHNVVLGRGCLIAAQVGIAGSTVLGDGVVAGGQAGLADHLSIGERAQIAAKAGVMSDVPAGEKWGGYPARPLKQWLREYAGLKKMTNKKQRN